MSMHLYNTLTRKKQPFEPVDPDHVRMYVCGPTVYDYAHIGNARPVVVFDVLARVLRHFYERVTYVRNITDIDDKINTAALKSGEDIRSITTRTTRAFHEDMAALGAMPPDGEPRATDHVQQMIGMIEKLMDHGNAYEAEGHVLFSVASMAAYGQLSGRSRDEMLAGARIEVAPYKRDPADFVLWKPSDEALPGWDSPWGRGRPGWHIECSAMSRVYLGDEFDIHGGGQDLIFPHHENELAQSRCANRTSHMARYWVHNGYLMVEGRKMSKSLGNFYTVHDLLEEFPGEAIRLALLQTHYRQPMDFTKDGIAEARRTLDRWYRLTSDGTATESVPESIMEALGDDLNTPKAIAGLHRLAGLAGTAGTTNDEARHARNGLLAGARFMGLLNQPGDDWFKWSPAQATTLDEPAIEAMISRRTKARHNKDFAASDRIRDELATQGILLEDSPEGTTWKRT